MIKLPCSIIEPTLVVFAAEEWNCFVVVVAADRHVVNDDGL